MTSAAETSVEAFLEAAEALADRAADPASLRALRAQGLTDFAEQGLPTRRLEAWRHTSLAALERIAWAAPAATGPVDPGAALAGRDVADIALVDGHAVVAPSAADQTGLLVGSIADAGAGGAGQDALERTLGQLADTKRDAFAALNTALLRDGALIEVERGAAIERPVQLTVLDTTPDRLACPRLAVLARAGSRATLVVEHTTVGAGPRLGAFVCEIVVEENAQLDVVVLEREGDESFLVSSLYTRQGRDARLSVHTVTVGGRLVRNGLSAELADTGAEIDMRGLFVGAGARHVDNHTVADHAVPHSTSRELYKGVLGGASHGVFCGRVVVRPDAQKTDSSQSNPNLLLTARAEIDTQPQLEIYADDVKCSHGSTIGRLDEDALFYLRSRGVGPDAARVMLTRGFANEIVEGLPDASVRERVGELVAAALEEASAVEGEATR